MTSSKMPSQCAVSAPEDIPTTFSSAQEAAEEHILSNTFFASIPVLAPADWDNLLLVLFPQGEVNVLNTLLHVVTSNRTLLYLIHNLGVYDNVKVFRKGVSNVFEIMVGAVYESQGWQIVTTWLEGMFTPIIYATFDGYMIL
ncbi:hypothetical protein DFH06DRAFT_1330625 [Mycena polygramma]|nr:hypothetical protein DFH06DRAFT_1330625 [Mycena polygramma]